MYGKGPFLFLNVRNKVLKRVISCKNTSLIVIAGYEVRLEIEPALDYNLRALEINPHLNVDNHVQTVRRAVIAILL